MEVKEDVMVRAYRTPIGNLMGSLNGVFARVLAITTGTEAIRGASICPDLIDGIRMEEVYGAIGGSSSYVGGGHGIVMDKRNIMFRSSIIPKGK